MTFPPQSEPDLVRSDLPGPEASSRVLASTVAELCEVRIEDIGPGFALSRGKLASSLGRALLDAKIRRRLGIKVPNLERARTFAELEAAVLSRPSGASAEAGSRTEPAPADQRPPAAKPEGGSGPTRCERRPAEGVCCGLDLEAVSGFAEVKDYWEDAFYRDNFTPSEIAYCVAQAVPRIHFAARWAAKEALKKCGAEHAAQPMNRIEVSMREDGSPFLRLGTGATGRTLPVALSLTHSGDWAAAVVVCAPAAMVPVTEAVGSRPERPPPGLALALGVLALLCALLALVGTGVALMSR
jgi:holo-[acyl-carrier protein] synthase